MGAERNDRDGQDNPFITESNFTFGQLLLNRFKMIGPLGIGGVGEVWLALDQGLNVERALKIPGQKLRFNQRAAQSLHKEAMLTARLEHPNMVKLHDFQWTPDGYPVLIFNYVPGCKRDGKQLGSLDDWLLHFRKMSEIKVRSILPPILEALHYAHTFRDQEIKHELIHLVHIPTRFDRRFRAHSTTHSGRIRPLIPEPFDHPFRRDSTSAVAKATRDNPLNPSIVDLSGNPTKAKKGAMPNGTIIHAHHGDLPMMRIMPSG